MAVRDRRRSGLRRAALGRSSVVALGAALYLAAGVVALSPAFRHASSDLLAYGTPRLGGVVTPGDHLQTTYNLWLPGHQLGDGRAPWVDPYSFQPEADPRINYAGWPFAVVFWPLHALFGTVGAWNAFALLSYVAAGGAAAAWLRSLRLPLGAALVGGLAFALAPYRSIQTSGGHLLGPIAALLPLSLWALERRRAWLAVVAIASIPLAGQVHLALGALAFFFAYAAVRRRAFVGLAGAAASIAAGLLVWATEIRGSTGASGRSFDQVERYSVELLDFVARHSRHGFETFAFLGWLVPLAAVAGLVGVWRRDRGLAAALGLGALVPVVLALGANTPLYEPVWNALPGLGETRVPARLLPIACLCLAGLAAFAVSRVPWRWAALAAIPLVALDLRVDVYRPMGADEGNAVYARIGEGRVLERPVQLPELQEGSVYLYYAIQAPRERPLGYSTTAPPEAVRIARELRSGRLDPTTLGVQSVVRFRNGRPSALMPPASGLHALVAFARKPSDATWSAVRLAESVRLGLGRRLLVTRSAEALREPSAWMLEARLFRGGAGPFSPLETLERHEGALVQREGSYRRCVSPPEPPPRSLSGLRRLSIQPRAVESCLRWFTVDVFVDGRGAVQAVTIDLWEP